MLELNLLAPVAMIQAVLPTMRRQDAGSIVNISSGTTFADVPGTGRYVASKIALERFSAIARNELDGTGITGSPMIPFATNTEFLTSIRAGRADAEAMTAGANFDTPEHVADAILQLIRSGEPRMDLIPAAYGRPRLIRYTTQPCSLTAARPLGDPVRPSDTGGVHRRPRMKHSAAVTVNHGWRLLASWIGASLSP